MGREQYQIIEQRDPEETCSQFVLGPEYLYVDQSLLHLQADVEYRNIHASERMEPGDIVFYLTPWDETRHVARAIGVDTVESKWGGNPNVYRHPLWGQPIPTNDIYFEGCAIFRKFG
jgi:hypothetical protein